MKENPRQSIGLRDAEDHKSWISDIKIRVCKFVNMWVVYAKFSLGTSAN